MSRLAVTTWFVIAGLLFVAMAVLSPRLKRVPLTAPVIYLMVGVALGPTVLTLFAVDPLEHSGWLEIVTEIAVLISLFSAGTKMPLPFTFKRWRAPLLLASVGMVATIALVAAFGALVLGLPLGAAVLLGAILAPTDPVLATDVQSRHPGDRDRLRFTLTCEAGVNDGAALPFAELGLGLLGLGQLGADGGRWFGMDLIWTGAAGIAIGLLVGWLLGRLVGLVQSWAGEAAIFEDLLGLGLIAIAYGAATLAQAGGFLAVFFAGVAFRRTEIALRPNESFGADHYDPELVSEISLMFEERLARVIEVALVLLVGGLLTRDAWSWRALGLAMFLFLVGRPVGVLLCLVFTRLPARLRVLAAWFGLRGIGSVYYVMYALEHGIAPALGKDLLQLTLVVVVLSIVLHGFSSTPLVQRYAGGD